MRHIIGRMARAALAAAMAVLAPVAVAQGSTELDQSPYFLVADPVPANPAAVPWARVTLGVGPVAADVESSAWSVRQVADIIGAIASGGDLGDALSGLPDAAETLRWAGSGRATVSIAAVQLGYGLVTAGSGTLPSGLLNLIQDVEDNTVGDTYELTGTRLVAAAWWDGFVRVNAPVPFVPRLLGIGGFSAGVGYHWLQGAGYSVIEGSGKIDPAGGGPGRFAVRSGEQASGSAYEVGAVARLNRFLAVEGAYLAPPRLTWTITHELIVEDTGPGAPKITEDDNVPRSEELRLPDVGLVGLHIRPLGSGLLELNGYYARIGLSQPQGLSRLQAEAVVNLLGLIRAVVGGARESGDPEWRLYASLGLGLGATSLSVRAVNLQEVAKGADAKSLGLALSASMGF